MIAGVMQPYFLPYFEYFRLMAACDVWVVFDTAQFVRRSWMTRNRVLNRDKGTAYISLPVAHAGEPVPVNLALIDESQDWRQSLRNRLRVYSGEAPYYERVMSGLNSVLSEEYTTVCDINVALLRWVSDTLNIDTPIALCSLLDVSFPERVAPGEWALHISMAVGATEYRNPVGGRALFDPDLFRRHNIALSFHEPRPRAYPTGRMSFVSDLSIVDWMMWNEMNTLKEWLKG